MNMIVLFLSNSERYRGFSMKQSAFFFKLLSLLFWMNHSSFLCWFCETNLSDRRYTIRDGFAVCLNCYEDKYGAVCRECQQRILIEMQVRNSTVLKMICEKNPGHRISKSMLASFLFFLFDL